MPSEQEHEQQPSAAEGQLPAVQEGSPPPPGEAEVPPSSGSPVDIQFPVPPPTDNGEGQGMPPAAEIQPAEGLAAADQVPLPAGQAPVPDGQAPQIPAASVQPPGTTLFPQPPAAPATAPGAVVQQQMQAQNQVQQGGGGTQSQSAQQEQRQTAAAGLPPSVRPQQCSAPRESTEICSAFSLCPPTGPFSYYLWGSIIYGFKFMVFIYLLFMYSYVGLN